MDIVFCLEAAEAAFMMGNPEIVNSDQGSQFTSKQFTELFEKKGAFLRWQESTRGVF